MSRAELAERYAALAREAEARQDFRRAAKLFKMALSVLANVDGLEGMDVLLQVQANDASTETGRVSGVIDKTSADGVASSERTERAS